MLFIPAVTARLGGGGSRIPSLLLSRRGRRPQQSRTLSALLTHQDDATPQNNHNHGTDAHRRRRRQQYHTTSHASMPRKSGASAFTKPRPPTRKARKKYHRRLRAVHHEKVGKHSPHGSRAAGRREFVEEEWKTLLDRADGKILPGGADGGALTADGEYDYDYGDAVLDDLMGNTAHLTSSPDPRPTYLGHLHDKFLGRVRGMMTGDDGGDGGDGTLLLEHGNTNIGSDADAQTLTAYHRLPSDHDVSLLLRSYRDMHQQSSKAKSIGLARALQHLFHEAKIPSSTFGTHTYSTLLTCCSNPAEARRVFAMMADGGVAIDDVCYAILVDIHARLGDYDGAAAVMDEMSSQRNLIPPMTAYTSLLAGCYRAINSGMASQSVKAEAGKLAWDKWKEMRIVGHDPDVMAYGALLRVLAAQGRPERAISILEEMDVMEVKPTALCFTSALRSVSRSHANTLRFQGGYSKKNKRRERIAAHHGRMVRSIVIKAENSEVRQDDGFVAALIMCAATAGDAATARAVYLANKVRRMKHLRKIGGEEHLRELRGEGRRDQFRLEEGSDKGRGVSNNGIGPVEELQEDTSAAATRVLLPSTGRFSQASQLEAANPRPPRRQSWQERVYGRDTRRLSALLHSCSRAMEVNGLGNMWAGRDNLGFLDEFSLRAIETRPRPKYVDRSIPGLSTVDHLPPEMWEKDGDSGVDTMSKRLRREKFRGIENKEEEMMRTIDELPDDLYDMLAKPEDRIPDRSGGGTIGDMELLSAGSQQDLLPEPSHAVEEQSFDDFADEVGDLVGGKAYYDAETGTVRTEPARPSEPEPEPEPETASVTVSPSDPPQDINDLEHEQVDMEALKESDPELYDLFMSQSSDDGEADDEYVSAEEEAAALEEIKKEDPELYEMLISGKGGDDVENCETDNAVEAESVDDNAEVTDGDNEDDGIDLFDEIDDELKAELESGDFDSFFASLKEEMEDSGENETVDEAEARELFELLRDGDGEHDDAHVTSDSDLVADKDEQDAKGSPPSFDGIDENLDFGSDEFQKLYAELEKDMQVEGVIPNAKEDETQDDKSIKELFPDYYDDPAPASGGASAPLEGSQNTLPLEERRRDQLLADPQMAAPMARPAQSAPQIMEATPEMNESDMSSADTAWSKDTEMAFQRNAAYEVSAASAPEEQSSPMTRAEQIQEELREALPGLPEKRIKQLQEQFTKTLGDPSLLRLVPILRERMPEYVNLSWLKQKNLRGAQTVMAKAEDDGLVDIHLLNGMLQVEASAGSLDRTIAYHEDEFARKKVQPTPYSDRLVLQMLVKNKRISRALAFKNKVESQGRHLDLVSYGSIVEHYGNHGQLGSALMMLKECIATHGAPPGEKSLSKIRLMCRKQGITKEVGLERMIGKDPLQWLRHGEEFQKRESSYKGRRDVTLPENRLLQI